jgi:hypothetical protein
MNMKKRLIENLTRLEVKGQFVINVKTIVMIHAIVLAVSLKDVLFFQFLEIIVKDVVIPKMIIVCILAINIMMKR